MWHIFKVIHPSAWKVNSPKFGCRIVHSSGPTRQVFLCNPSCPLLKQAISSRSEGCLKPSPNREDIVDDTITTIYCLCDEFLKAIGHRDDPQARLSTAELMTVPLVAAAFF